MEKEISIQIHDYDRAGRTSGQTDKRKHRKDMKNNLKKKALSAINGIKKAKNDLLAIIEYSVPEDGISLTSKQSDNLGHLTVYGHFDGEPGYLRVEKILPGRLEGRDSYGNEVTRCSLQQDCTIEAIAEVAALIATIQTTK